MTMKNMTLTGQGISHPESSLSDITGNNFAAIVPVISGQIGGYVYVALSDIGLVKVGKTRNVPARMKQLSSGSGIVITKAEIFGPLLNYGTVELCVHAKLSEERRSGEWFSADFDTVSSIVSAIAERYPTGTELIDEDEYRSFKVCLWLDANKHQTDFEVLLLSLLSDDARQMLSAYGYPCTAYIASCLENFGCVILSDGTVGHDIYPFGYRKEPLHVLENDWRNLDECEEEDTFSEHVIDINSPEKFRQEAEEWRTARINRIYADSLEDAQRWLAKRLGADDESH